MSLIPLLENALNCFEYVQLSPRFQENFQDRQLRLNEARLRLSRWGQAASLASEPGRGSLARIDHSHAEHDLSQINRLFSDRERAYFNSENPQDNRVLSVEDNMDHTGRILHGKIQTLVGKRRNNLDVAPRRKWVLFEERDYDGFLDLLIGHISSLLNTFPASHRALLQELCMREVSEFGRNDLNMLWGVAASQDQDLEEATRKKLKSTQTGTGAQNINNMNSPYSKFNIIKQVAAEYYNGTENYTFDNSAF